MLLLLIYGILGASLALQQCPGVPLGRHLNRPKWCKKDCSNNVPCKPHKKCACDGECGLSCINPALLCPDLTEIPHGHIHWNGEAHFDSNAEYSCHPGYVLDGPSQRRCQGNKEWSGANPVCRLQMRCGPPPDVAFALSDGSSFSGEYEINSEVHYSCVPGYHRFSTKSGLNIAKCLLNRNSLAQWYGPEIKCKARSCSDPGVLENGKRDGDIFEYPHTLTFTCDSGFLLVGSTSRQCESTGEWTGEQPTCKPTECPRPSDPLHGRALGSSLTFQSVVTYSCDTGYRFVGQKQRTCLADGMWNGYPGMCEEIRCPPLPPLVNGYIEGGETHFGAKAVFRCLESMSHSGPNEAVCGDGGQWSVQPPICLASCTIPSIEHGQSRLGNTHLPPGRLVPSGTTVQVLCNPRHEPSPPAPMECGNSSWNHVPICKPLSCVEWPPRVPHARVLFTKSEHGFVARYTCASGFHLNSDKDTIKCLYGNWTREGEPLQCVETSCSHPSETFGSLEYGSVMLEGLLGAYDFAPYINRVKEGCSILFQCNKGYYLIGAPKASCVNGQWMPKIKPACESQTHPLIDGQIVWDRTRRELGSERPIPTPKEGKSEGRRRQRRKHRRARQPRCPVVESDANRTVVLHNEGEISIVCHDGWEVEGSSGSRESDWIKCVDGAWTPPLPNCSPSK